MQLSSTPDTSSRTPRVKMEYFQLGSLTVPRIWTGLWQLSSAAWGTAPTSRILEHMRRHYDEAYTAFADHYGSAELLFGQFRVSLPEPHSVIGATKWCVFRPIALDREKVEKAVDERCHHMKGKHVDLLQFHWQDYSNPEYLEALHHLRALQLEGRIRELGLCNFDAVRTDEICTNLGPGVIVSNQVQFSLVDTRPLHGMAHVCEKHNVKLLTYGTLCGGFLSDQWLEQPEPDAYDKNMTPSQRKYLDMITKAWGTWDLFQKLLTALRGIGDSHGRASIANVATRWVLDHPFVGAVIIGARLGIAEHTDDNHRVFSFKLTKEDNDAIERVLRESNGEKLITSIGDCGAEYR